MDSPSLLVGVAPTGSGSSASINPNATVPIPPDDATTGISPLAHGAASVPAAPGGIAPGYGVGAGVGDINADLNGPGAAPTATSNYGTGHPFHPGAASAVGGTTGLQNPTISANPGATPYSPPASSAPVDPRYSHQQHHYQQQPQAQGQRQQQQQQHQRQQQPQPQPQRLHQQPDLRGSAATSVLNAASFGGPTVVNTSPTTSASILAVAPIPASETQSSNSAPPINGTATVGNAPTGNGPAAPPKKRKSGPGSRGVANLTPEQLARKRANDREAQRAIRERQRLRTEQYEREIRELKSQEPYRKLQAALQQKEAVEAELAEVKRCLHAILAMIQPILGAAPVVGAVGGPTAAESPSATSPVAVQAAHPAQPLSSIVSVNPVSSTPTSVASPVSASTHGRWHDSLSPVTTSVSVDAQTQPAPPQAQLVPLEMQDQQQRCGPVPHGLELGSDRLPLDFLLAPDSKHKIARIQSGVNGAQDSPKYRHVPMKHDWTATSNMPAISAASQGPPTHLYAPAQQEAGSHAIPTALPSAPYPPATTDVTDLAFYNLLPKNCAPTCPLDSLLLDFLAERRQRAAEGLPHHEIVGPRYPSVSSLLNPAVSVYSHPLSKVFTDILARFPDIHTLPERVAVLYLMFLFMRWQVSPTPENYARLPVWFRPCRSQTEREHPAWLDHLPFPGMRDRLVRTYDREPGGFPFDNFFIPFTSTLSVNWPYEDTFVLLASPDGDELMINPVFEQHLRMLDNWTLGEAFDRAFPGLKGTYNLKR